VATKYPISRPKLLGRALARHCPQCGSRGVFANWFKLNERCPHCGLASDRVAGHFVGAVGFNTIFSFGMLLIVLLLGTWAMYPHINVPVLLLVCFATAVAMPILFWPFSQSLWQAFDLAWRPAEEAELDPRYTAELTGTTLEH